MTTLSLSVIIGGVLGFFGLSLLADRFYGSVLVCLNGTAPMIGNAKSIRF